MKKTRKFFSIITVVALLLTIAGAQVPANAEPPEMVKVIISFHEAPGQAEKNLIKNAGGNIKHSYKIIPAMAGSVPASALKGLNKNPKIKIIEMDAEIYALDAELDAAWGVKHIGAGIVHGNNQGTGIKVAVLDTGIDYNHIEFKENYAGGRDFVNNDSDPMDDNGHGTHVAGTIAAENNDIGVVGVAPEAQIYAYKILNKRGRGDVSTVIAVLDQAIVDEIQVTNNSYGSSLYVEAVKEAFDVAANDHGMIHIASAGNSGDDLGIGDNVGYPARYESVIAVAATDSDDVRARFSSTGSAVEISAPGVGILSTYPGNRLATMSGTSMASPHVAGTVALMLKSGVSSDDIRERLQNTADDLGDSNWYGYGLVDADEAVLGGSTANNSPVAYYDGLVTTDEDTAVNITLTANDLDGDLLTYSIETSPSNGTLSGIAPSVVYTPNENYNGSDSFTFKANDRIVDSNVATVDITITPVGDAPISYDQSVATNKDTPINITLTAIDPDGDSLTYIIETDPLHEGVALDADFINNGKLVYTPDLNTDSYSFTFKVNDGTIDSNSATVNISVVVAEHMSVKIIDNMSFYKKGVFYSADVNIEVTDESDSPIAGVIVRGKWSITELTAYTDFGSTDLNGIVSFRSEAIKKPESGTTYTFTITSVEKLGYSWYGSGDSLSLVF
ncbi:S8 family serine peptidase [Candidatus Parcubacteria bacterium]|nr:S8 family serine peptidase [Candidatus Parcubacteria bacterium]